MNLLDLEAQPYVVMEQTTCGHDSSYLSQQKAMKNESALPVPDRRQNDQKSDFFLDKEFILKFVSRSFNCDVLSN